MSGSYGGLDMEKERLTEGISKNNMERLDALEEELYLQVADSSRELQMRMLYIFARIIKKDFRKVTRNELQHYFRNRRSVKVSNKNLTPDYLGQEILYVRKLYKFLRQENKMLGIGRKKKTKNVIHIKKILSEAEIEALIESTNNARDKALFKFVADTGCRIKEALNMTIGDIDFTSQPPLATIDGKTGPRTVPLMTSATTMQEYIEHFHPYKNDPKSDLWLTLDSQCKKLSYSTAYKNLKASARRADIRKNVSPHILRHSRATEVAKRGLPQDLANKYFGWTRNSNMFATYTNTTQQDLINHLDMMYGNKPDIKLKPSKLADIHCSRCNELNPVENKFCRTCNYPLHIDVSLKEIKIIELLRSEFYKDMVEDAKIEQEPIDINYLASEYDELIKQSQNQKRKKV